MESQHKHRTRAKTLTIIAFFVTLAIHAVFSLNPLSEAWGVSPWRYLPLQFTWGTITLLFIIGLVASIGYNPKSILSFFNLLQTINRKATLMLVVIGAAIVFYFLRAKTHFLGDGYTLLANLATDNPLVKPRSIGESFVHIWVKNGLGSLAESAALASYQVVSITCGVIFIVLTVLGSRHLFKDSKDRALFAIGVSLGGYSLLHFGYVENYSILTLMTLSFCLHSLLTIRGILPKWSLALIFIITALVHIMGVVLLPGLIYVLARRSSISRTWNNVSSTRKIIAITITTLAMCSIFYWKLNTDLFFEMAFLPLWETRFTVDDYTLFSLHHISDFISLIGLLCPWFLIALVTLVSSQLRFKSKKGKIRSDVLFLAIVSATSLGMAFIIDPKLGLARDWDLLAFAGVPLSILFFLTVLSSENHREHRLWLTGLCLALALGSLSGSVVAQAIPSAAELRFKDVLESNKGRSRASYQTLQDYYISIGDTSLALETADYYRTIYPEVDIVINSGQFLRTGDIDAAIAENYKATAIAPAYGPAYTNIGLGYLRKGQRDSALVYLKIADALNPYNQNIERALKSLERSNK